MTTYEVTLKARRGTARHVIVLARTLREAWAKAENAVMRRGERITHVGFAGFAHELA